MTNKLRTESGTWDNPKVFYHRCTACILSHFLFFVLGYRFCFFVFSILQNGVNLNYFQKVLADKDHSCFAETEGILVFHWKKKVTRKLVCQADSLSKRSTNRSSEGHVSTMKDNQIKCKCGLCDSFFLLLVLDALRGPFSCKGTGCT